MSVSSKSPQEIVLSPELKEMYAYIDEHKDDAQSFKFDLDDIWRHLGYKKKERAAYQVEKLSKNVHFVCCRGGGSKSGSNNSGDEPPPKKAKWGGHNRKVYMLSALGLEKLATACGTEVGKQIRAYLVQLRHAVRDGNLNVAAETVRNYNEANNTDTVMAHRVGDQDVVVRVRPSQSHLEKKQKILEENEIILLDHEQFKIKSKIQREREQGEMDRVDRQSSYLARLLSECGETNVPLKQHLESMRVNVIMSYDAMLPPTQRLTIESSQPEPITSKWKSLSDLIFLENVKVKRGHAGLVGRKAAKAVREAFPDEKDRNSVMQYKQDGVRFADNGKAVYVWFYKGDAHAIVRGVIQEHGASEDASSTSQGQGRTIGLISSFFS